MLKSIELGGAHGFVTRIAPRAKTEISLSPWQVALRCWASLPERYQRTNRFMYFLVGKSEGGNDIHLAGPALPIHWKDGINFARSAL